MTSLAEFKPEYDPANEGPFGPSTIDKRTASTPLTSLGTSFMEFSEDGASDPWTLRYEETIYVISGSVDIAILDEHDGLIATVTGATGDLLALPMGTNVRYHGQKGTRLLLSITPVNWRDL